MEMLQRAEQRFSRAPRLEEMVNALGASIATRLCWFKKMQTNLVIVLALGKSQPNTWTCRESLQHLLHLEVYGSNKVNEQFGGSSGGVWLSWKLATLPLYPYRLSAVHQLLYISRFTP